MPVEVEKAIEGLREEGRVEGRQEGRLEGEIKGEIKTYVNLLRKGVRNHSFFILISRIILLKKPTTML